MTHWSSEGQVAFAWWQALNGQGETGEESRNGGDAAARARLRRAASPLQALAEARAVQLAQMLGMNERTPPLQLQFAGALAAVLAHVRNNVSDPEMATLLGPRKGQESAAMSDLRFRRLLAARTPIDLMRQMRAAVQLLRGEANVADISHAMLRWNDDTRVRWTYAYWQAAFASPSSGEETTGEAEQAEA